MANTQELLKGKHKTNQKYIKTYPKYIQIKTL